MPTVPKSSGSEGGMPDELNPSQTNLLMAAAQMHQQGRLFEDPEAKGSRKHKLRKI